jgi:5-methylthioribose kinase
MIDIRNQSELENYLELLSYSKIASLDKAGEGNMNDTLRVKFVDNDSVIVKQSKAFVAKYPDIAAPEGRVNAESRFYELASDLVEFHPKILHKDPSNNILIMEDLGESSDLSYLYEKGTLSEDSINFIVDYLSQLNAVKAGGEKHQNLEMRQLNDEYIFKIPFSGELDDMIKSQDEKLFEGTRFIVSSNDLKIELAKLSAIYMKDADHLLHGDFYPASILDSKSGLKVIDAEFSFFGIKEWDVAVFCAHLMMCAEAHNQAKTFLRRYLASNKVDENLIKAFCGVEILRRMIGVAQVDFKISLEQKLRLARHAKSLILAPEETPICH